MPWSTLIFALLCLLARTAQGSNLLVSHFSGIIYTLGLSDGGNLTVTSTIKAGGVTPSWLTLDSAPKTLYSTDESQAGNPTLTSLYVREDGTLKVTGQAPTTGGEVHSSVYGGHHGDGYIAVAEYDQSTVTTYKLPLSSSSNVLQKLKFAMNGTGAVPSRQEKPHPHSIFPDPTGKYLLAPDLGADLIRIFAINAASGQLTGCPPAQTGAGDGPRHGAFWISPEGGVVLYVVNELGNSVTTWTAEYPGHGCLALNKTQSSLTYPEGKTPPEGSKASEVHVAGDFVYVSNRNDQSFGPEEDSIASYAIDVKTGRIAFLQASSAYGYFPRTFAINKAADLVAIGGQTSSTLAVVARNSTTGLLGGLVAKLALGTPGTVNQEDGLSAVVWDE